MKPVSVKAIERRIKQRKLTVGVVGQGYVGLPLAMAFAKRGFKVIGFDVDRSKIEKLMRGVSYIGDIPSATVKEMLRKKRFTATSDPAALETAGAILICVPTPLDAKGDPDLSYVNQTGAMLAEHLQPGQIISLESTTYPGTTREILLPQLENAKTSYAPRLNCRATGRQTAGRKPLGKLKVEKDFFLAFSPERVDPGNKKFPVEKIPKVVGGMGPGSTRLAAALYGCISPKILQVSSPEVAETTKMLENTYRAVNIAMINEMKIALDKMGIDVWEVIKASSTKPFGFKPFYPGPGFGGHCIPLDPFYFSWRAAQFGFRTRFIELAGVINKLMPKYVVRRAARELFLRFKKKLRGSKILVLGVAYKKDIDDVRESPGLEVIEELLREGAKVSYSDPHVPALHKMRRHDLPLRSEPLTPRSLRRFDAAIMITDHARFPRGTLARNLKLIVDTRNYFAAGASNITKA